MPFRFRLQKVLDLRQRKVDTAAQELAAAARRTAGVARRIAQLDAEVDRLQQKAGRRTDSFPVHERIALNQWLAHQADRRGGLCVELSRVRAEEEERRREMTRAWQDVEVLKKLRERQRQHWQQEHAKRESREMDEIGVQRADRRRREKLASALAQVADEGRTG